MSDAPAGDTIDIECDMERLGEHLPVGVVVLAADGRIVHVNERVLEMTGYGRDDLVGASALTLIHGDDGDFVARALHAGAGSDGVMGPIRLRYRTRDDRPRWSEFWAQGARSILGIDGYIVTMAIESVTDFLTGATYQIASGVALDTTLDAAARAVAGFPLVAYGSIITYRAGAHACFGEWPLDLALDDLPREDAPWHQTMISGEPSDTAVLDLPPALARPTRAAGIESVWTRPITDQRGSVVAAFVVWRSQAGDPSPNQARHLAEAVGVARLAFAHDDHRGDLERAALTDHLTGLGNRARLAQRLAVVDERRVAVLYVDLDGFKSVNDEHGHEVGDLVLRATARRLQSIVRDSDDVFRIGGDEFVVLCAASDQDDRDSLDQIATRVVESLDHPFRIGERLVGIGASVGIAEREAGESTRDVIRRADHALLDAKRAGKHQWCFAGQTSAK